MGGCSCQSDIGVGVIPVSPNIRHPRVCPRAAMSYQLLGNFQITIRIYQYLFKCFSLTLYLEPLSMKPLKDMSIIYFSIIVP